MKIPRFKSIDKKCKDCLEEGYKIGFQEGKFQAEKEFKGQQKNDKSLTSCHPADKIRKETLAEVMKMLKLCPTCKGTHGEWIRKEELKQELLELEEEPLK